MDLLCMRDMLDDAHKQLEMLRQKNIDLENRIVSLVAASAKPENRRSIFSDFDEQSGAGQLYKCIAAEQYCACSKMEEWEGELRILWQEARKNCDELPAGERGWLLRLLPVRLSFAG